MLHALDLVLAGATDLDRVLVGAPTLKATSGLAGSFAPPAPERESITGPNRAESGRHGPRTLDASQVPISEPTPTKLRKRSLLALAAAAVLFGALAVAWIAASGEQEPAEQAVQLEPGPSKSDQVVEVKRIDSSAPGSAPVVTDGSSDLLPVSEPRPSEPSKAQPGESSAAPVAADPAPRRAKPKPAAQSKPASKTTTTPEPASAPSPKPAPKGPSSQPKRDPFTGLGEWSDHATIANEKCLLARTRSVSAHAGGRLRSRRRAEPSRRGLGLRRQGALRSRRLRYGPGSLPEGSNARRLSGLGSLRCPLAESARTLARGAACIRRSGQPHDRREQRLVLASAAERGPGAPRTRSQDAKAHGDRPACARRYTPRTARRRGARCLARQRPSPGSRKARASGNARRGDARRGRDLESRPDTDDRAAIWSAGASPDAASSGQHDRSRKTRPLAARVDGVRHRRGGLARRGHRGHLGDREHGSAHGALQDGHMRRRHSSGPRLREPEEHDGRTRDHGRHRLHRGRRWCATRRDLRAHPRQERESSPPPVRASSSARPALAWCCRERSEARPISPRRFRQADSASTIQPARLNQQGRVRATHPGSHASPASD